MVYTHLIPEHLVRDVACLEFVAKLLERSGIGFFAWGFDVNDMESITKYPVVNAWCMSICVSSVCAHVSSAW